ncbi:IS1634 family transposase, partial [Piscirickettsia litoralis]|uniref:IS1634 family transposase n=1 Tax=Piscirickettsia litoralis TaxID=1891921 RepID=UPI001F47E81F
MHIETNNMAPPSNLSSKTINHLGLVAGMYDELEIGELIDKIIPQDKIKRVVSIGQTVKAMVLNGLGFTNRAMYLTPLFFKDKPTERLIAQGINPEHLNDDLLGRSLDKLYEYGVESLYSQISAYALKLLGLNGKFSHLDSTSFHVDGKYNHEQSEDEHIIHISKGHSRDHRPDLNQVILQLICDGKAG